MSPGIVNSSDLIGSMILLAVASGTMEIQSDANHLGAVRRFFDKDPQFQILGIEHQEKIATVRFEWRPLEKETP